MIFFYCFLTLEIQRLFAAGSFPSGFRKEDTEGGENKHTHKKIETGIKMIIYH